MLVGLALGGVHGPGVDVLEVGEELLHRMQIKPPPMGDARLFADPLPGRP